MRPLLKKLAILIGIGALTASCAHVDESALPNAAIVEGGDDAWIVSNPSSDLVFNLSRSEDGSLTYSVTRDGSPVIEPSPLGIAFQSADFRAVESVTPVEASASASELGVHAFLLDNGKTTLRLEVFSSEDGVAFRYVNDGADYRHLVSESSSWTFPKATKIWFFERPNDWKLKSYAGYWTSAPVEEMLTISPTGPVQGNPLVGELADGSGYVLVTEAALYDHSGVRLEAVGDRRFVANFDEGKEGFTVEGPYVSPWRVVLVADDLDALVNATIIEDLNPEPDAELFANTSWIKPGKSVWHWWCCRLGSPDEERRMIDTAALLGFEHSIIDDGWERWTDNWETVADLAAHGGKKDVLVWVWKHSNELDDPADNWFEMRSWLDKVEGAGLAGIKVDFMNAEDHQTILFMTTLLEESAKRELMVNFHGSNAAHGEAKTYPNELTREGIRGLELNHMEEGPITAEHNAALPFTRLALGHGDYTPLGFSQPGDTSWAHQLATVIAMTSPMQVIAEDPEFLLSEERVARILPFLREVPTVWDKTRILPGSAIGELAIMARSTKTAAGEVWYVAVMNGGAAKKTPIDLSFLGTGAYDAFQVTDDIAGGMISIQAADPRELGPRQIQVLPFVVKNREVTASDTVTVDLARHGGAVLVLKPKG